LSPGRLIALVCSYQVILLYRLEEPDEFVKALIEMRKELPGTWCGNSPRR
jgi:hypothetical protein